MKYLLIAIPTFALAAVASAEKPWVPRLVKPTMAYGFCHTQIYCDYTGCHNIVVCN